MSIGTGWHARLWVTFALTARCIAGQATQSGCNANGPRVPCGENNIKMLNWGCSFPGDLRWQYAIVLKGNAAGYCLHSPLLYILKLMCCNHGATQHVNMRYENCRCTVHRGRQLLESGLLLWASARRYRRHVFGAAGMLCSKWRGIKLCCTGINFTDWRWAVCSSCKNAPCLPAERLCRSVLRLSCHFLPHIMC